MPTIVEKLQADAMNPNVPVGELLRRVKYTAAKLGLGSIEDWVEQEQNGWNRQPPEYRLLHGRPMCHHPYQGWQELRGSSDWMTRRYNNQAIATIEAMLRAAKPGTSAHVPFPAEISEKLNKANGSNEWVFVLDVPMGEVARIPEAVRNLVLDWALNLEKSGIMGSDDGFNSADKEKAQAASMIINIQNHGTMTGNNFGEGNTSGDANIELEKLTPILDQLKQAMPVLVGAGVDEEQFKSRIAALEEALLAKKPSSTIRGLITDVRNAVSGAAGNLIATGAISALNAILGTGVPMAR